MNFIALWLICSLHAAQCKPETAFVVIGASPAEYKEVCASVYYRTHWPKLIRLDDGDHGTTLACKG